jgi:hypothetical protein
MAFFPDKQTSIKKMGDRTLLDVIKELGWLGVVLLLVAALCVAVTRIYPSKKQVFLIPLFLGITFWGYLNNTAFSISITPGLDTDAVALHVRAQGDLILAFSAIISFLILLAGFYERKTSQAGHCT